MGDGDGRSGFSPSDGGTQWEADGAATRVPGNLDEALAFMEANDGLLSDEEVEKIRATLEKFMMGGTLPQLSHSHPLLWSRCAVQ